MNQASISGRLTRNPEVRKTTEGSSVCTFTVAVDRNVKRDESNPNQITADFIQCVAWRQSAEYLYKYGKQGSWIEVEGRIQTRNYTNNEGQKIYVTELVASHLRLLRTASDHAEKATAEPQKEQERESYSEPQTPPEQPKEKAFSQQSADRMNWDGDMDGTALNISADDLPF